MIQEILRKAEIRFQSVSDFVHQSREILKGFAPPDSRPAWNPFFEILSEPSQEAFIEGLYRTLFGRDGDPEGSRNLVELLRLGAISRLDAIRALDGGIEGLLRNPGESLPFTLPGGVRSASIRRARKLYNKFSGPGAPGAFSFLLLPETDLYRFLYLRKENRLPETLELREFAFRFRMTPENLKTTLEEVTTPAFPVIHRLAERFQQSAPRFRKILQHLFYGKRQQDLERIENENLLLRLGSVPDFLLSRDLHRDTESRNSGIFHRDSDPRRSHLEQTLPSDTTRNGSSQPPNSEELYQAYEDVFYNSRNVREKQKIYLPCLSEVPGRILDAGCGRGEFLELLKDSGRRAIGIEINGQAARTARKKGIDVIEKEAISFLETNIEVFAGITAFQFIEHLPADRLEVFLRLALHNLAPGGSLILETINPHCIRAFPGFFGDLTHHHPVLPETLEFLLRNLGLAELRILYSNPVREIEGRPPSRTLFYDFALVGRKPLA